MLGARQRRHETRVFHQLPGWQIDTPGLRQARLVAVFVAQLLEERALGRHVGGHFQGAVRERVTVFRVIAGTGPGQFVVGEVTDQPRIVAVVAGGDGDGTLGGHGETRIEGVGHAAPPVEAGLDGGVIALDRQRQRVGHALAGVEGRVAPVAQGVEAPGLETVEAVADPALRVVAAIGARQVGAIEVVPAALVEGAALVGVGLGAVFALAEVAGEGLVVLGQRLEHGLTPLDVGLAQPRRHRIDPQREEGMAFRGHQEPAVAALLGAEEAAGLEGLAAQPAAKGILLRQLGGPVGQLLLLVLGALLQLFVVLHLVRPLDLLEDADRRAGVALPFKHFGQIKAAEVLAPSLGPLAERAERQVVVDDVQQVHLVDLFQPPDDVVGVRPSALGALVHGLLDGGLDFWQLEQLVPHLCRALLGVPGADRGLGGI
ncbi:hypothetical protein D9M71_286240 [compost metagenome]